MRKAFVAFVSLLFVLNMASAQYTLEVLDISDGLLKLAASNSPGKETDFYFNSQKNEVVANKTDGDLKGKVYATKDTVKLRMHYIASDRPALYYDLAKQGNNLPITNVVWITNGGLTLVKGVNLNSGKGYLLETYEGYERLHIYREGKKQENYLLDNTSGNLFTVKAMYKGKLCYGVLQKNGDVIIPAIYKSLKKHESTGYFVVNIDGNQGVLSPDGKEIIPCKFKNIEKVTDKLYKVQIEHIKDGSKDWTYGLFDLQGNMVSPPINTFISFDEGLAAIAIEEGKFGYVNEVGIIVIPAQYKSARPFRDGLALVENSAGLFGFVDQSGNLKIPYKYTFSSDFSNGKAIVAEDPKKKKIYKIDKNGNKVK